MGIDTGKFGFADNSTFLAAEKQDPQLLESYAKWVMLRPRDEAYEKHARETVPKLTDLVSTVLEEDKLEGSCEMACSLITKGLDRLGVWSVGIVGSATFEVKDEGIWLGLHTVDRQDFPGAKLGHTWVCAPPFVVVDASIKRQRWSGDSIEPYIPSSILDDVGRKTKPTSVDVISAEIRSELLLRRGSLPPSVIHEFEPNLRAFGKTFPATEIIVDQLTARYVPTASGLSDGAFEDINTNGTHGRDGREIWHDVIAPAFGSN
ncbi:MAG: hypothetical protein AAGF48_13135 [Pseudomonadota bacterium]